MRLLVAVLLLVLCGTGSAQITCYTTPSSDVICAGNSFVAATIDECCMDPNGYFFDGGGTASCTPCIVFGWFNGTELTLQEQQSQSHILTIGFIKGGTVQDLTAIDNNNRARFMITIIEGNATQGANADFTISTTSFQIIGPDITEPFSLSTTIPTDNVALETAEDFVLSLTGVNNAGMAILAATADGQFASPMIRVVIEDTESAQLQFTESDYSNEESVGFIRPVVQLTTEIATDLTIEIVPEVFVPVLNFNPRRPNNATGVADFSTDRLSVTFSAGGTTSLSMDIVITDDTINEVEQVFVILLQVASAVDVNRVDLQSGRSTSLGRIFDNDPINIGFGQERYTVSEADVAGGGMMRIPIIKENDQQSEVTFEVLATLLTGSGLNAAVEGMNGDFQANTTQSQDFVPDEQVIYFQFELFDDELPEPVEQFEIQLSLPDVAGLTGINLGGSLFPRATVVIVDNDDVIIGWEQNVTCVNETQGTLELCISIMNLDAAQELALAEISLSTNTIRGTAADPEDYGALQENDDGFPFITDINRRACITVQITNDDILEGVEYFSIEVVPDPFETDFPPNVQLEPNVTFVKILDDDFITIGFNQTDFTAIEGTDGVVTVYVAVLQGDLRASVSVIISTQILILDTATPDADFSSLTRVVVLDENTNEVPVEITIINDDVFEEFLETFTLSLAQDPAGSIDTITISPDAATVTIQDNDVATIGYDPVLYTVSETAGTVAVNISLLQGDLTGLMASAAILVNVSAESFTATADVNFNFAPLTLRFDGMNTEFTLPVSIIDDDITEGPEVFFMLAVSSNDRVQITPDRANVTIIDEDAVEIGFVETAVTVGEGAGQVVVNVALLIGTLEREVSVDVITLDGTAVAPADYTTTVQRLTFGPSSVLNDPVPVFINITNNDQQEFDETFSANLTLVPTSLAVVLMPSVATVTIEDDDLLLFTFERQMYTFSEDSGNGTVCVNKTGDTIQTIGIMIQGDLQPGLGNINQMLTFEPTDTQVCVIFLIQDDNIGLEPTENLTFIISVIGSVTGIDINPYNTTTVMIVDEDVPPEFLVPPVDLTVVQPEDAVFTCRATGRPRPVITWHTQDDNGMEVDIIDMGGVTEIVGQDIGDLERMSTLTIVQTEPRDARNYICRARNTVLMGEANASAALTVHVIPEITFTENYLVEPMDEVVFECNATGIPAPNINWYRDGDLLNEAFDSRISLGDPIVIPPADSNDVYEVYRTLTFDSTTNGDAGTYTCVADNGNAQMPNVTQNFDLLLTVAPVIIFTENYTVSQFDEAVFECNATGIPAPDINWYRNGILLNEAADSRISLGDPVVTSPATSNDVYEVYRTLTFNSTRDDDTGTYTCVADNGIRRMPNVTQDFELLITVAPEITFTENYTVNQFDEVVFECNATGILAPSINWYRNGVRLNEAFDSRISLGDPIVTPPATSNDVYEVYRTLTFNYTRDADTGIYTCVADNGNARMPNTTQNFELFIRVAPAILTPPQDLTVVVPENATFFCEATARPAPTITWWRVENGGPVLLLNGADYTIVGGASGERIRSSTLTVVETQLSDALEYFCRASNMAGTNDATADLTVHVVPEIIFTEDYTLNQFAEVIFECNATGVPAPNINWFRNGNLLNEGSDSRISIGDPIVTPPATSDDVYEVYRTLTFSSTMDADAGTYTCVADNGNARMPNVMQDFELFLPVIPDIIFTEDYTVNQFDPVVFECNATGIPPPFIEWYRNGVLLNAAFDPRISLSIPIVIPPVTRDSVFNVYRTLTLSTTTDDDTGTYTCLAGNGIVQMPNVTQNFELLVRVAPNILQLDGPPGLTVVQPENANFFCQATAQPAATITWWRDEAGGSVQLTNGADYNIVDGTSMGRISSSTLTVVGTQPSDALGYRCIAQNPAGMDEEVVQLTVHVVPVIEFPEDEFEYEVIPFQRIIFVCRATGIPAPIVNWYRNGILLSENVDQRISLGTPVQTPPEGPDGMYSVVRLLNFLSTRVGDSNTYTCLASNQNTQMPNATQDFQLFVNDGSTSPGVGQGPSASCDCDALIAIGFVVGVIVGLIVMMLIGIGLYIYYDRKHKKFLPSSDGSGVEANATAEL